MTNSTAYETQYLRLLSQVLSEGETYLGRGTIPERTSLWQQQLRTPLCDEEGNPILPIITTKQVAIRWVAEELRWFLSGSTFEPHLSNSTSTPQPRHSCPHHKGPSIWKEWATAEQCAKYGREAGNLGKGLYGYQWRSSGEWSTFNIEKRPALPHNPLWDVKSTKRPHFDLHLGDVWKDMHAQCTDPQHPRYFNVGAKGFTVCERWQSYDSFVIDAPILQGWANRQARPDSYVLNFQHLAQGTSINPDTACWVPSYIDLAYAEASPFIARSQEGEEIYHIHRPSFEKLYPSQVWTYTPVEDRNFRFQGPIDQLARVIQSLRNDPYGTRHIISAWNPAESNNVALPPCHTLVHFSVRPMKDGRLKLNSHLYQRSADLFLGVPYNVTSYALLTHLIAYALGYVPGEFVHTLGDAHLYGNSYEAVRTQLTRTPTNSPTLELSLDGETPLHMVLGFVYPEMKLGTYTYQGPIHVEVNV